MVFVFYGKSTAELALVLEVAHSLACFVERLIVRNIDNCGAKGAVNVTSDLGLDLEDVAGFFLNNQGNLDGGGGILGEIVEDEEIFIFGETHFHFFLI